MTLTEFIAEIQAELPTYADDMDKITIKTNVLEQLRIFGNNICDMSETIVKVKNSRALLPENFKSLRLALKTEPFGCTINGDKRNITDSYIYKERIENPAYFYEVNQEYIKSCNSKIITEKITINNTAVDFYHRVQWLSLTPGLKKKFLTSDCLNLHPSIRNSYSNEISITARTLNANFKDGDVYLQYYALPTDEYGEIIIPEITTGDILRYIKTYVKVQIAELLIANNLNPQGIAQLYPVWQGQLPYLRISAQSEAKFKGAGKKWNKNLQKMNRREFSKFSLPNLSL